MGAKAETTATRTARRYARTENMVLEFVMELVDFLSETFNTFSSQNAQNRARKGKRRVRSLS